MMRRIRLAGSAAAVVALGAVPAFAVDPASSETFDAATVRAPFLSRGVGARGVAMGGAFTAVADDASAVLLNPGGLGQVAGFQAAVQYAAAGEEMSHNVAALAMPAGPGVAGLGVNMLSLGEFESRDAMGALLAPESLSEFSAAAGYAIKNPKWLGIQGWTGLALEFVQDAGGGGQIAGSIGSVLLAAENFNVGLAAQHLGAGADGFALPATVKGGANWFMPGLLRVAVEGGAGLSDGVAWVGGGVEVLPVKALALRAGYRMPFADQAYGGLAGLTAGAGFRLGNLTLDYALQPYGDLATGHLVTLSYRKAQWIPYAGEGTKLERKLLNVAVMDMTAQNMSAGDAAVITDLLRSELVKTRKFNVLERGNMEKILAEQAFQQTGCTSDDCAVKLGKMLNCQRMVSGSLGKLAAEYYLNVRVVDIETGRVLWSDSAGAKAVRDLTKQLPDLAAKMAKKLN